jgi:S1-C subfamily serine protease
MPHPARLFLALLVCGPLAGLAVAQQSARPPSAFELASAMEQVLVEAIARGEGSVVAIARVKEHPAEAANREYRPDPFGRHPALFATPSPGDPDFIPSEYATGVVIDRRGLILTAYHCLGEESAYYVTTRDRKVYRATIKAADPRSDLAVLSINASDLTPIVFGDAASLRKGQIVIALGNPYAIARDGQASASWGIVANLARKAPLLKGDSDSLGKTTLHHFGTLIQTDAKLNLATSGGALLNLKGEMVGLTTSLPATAGYEQAAGYAFPVDEAFRRAVDLLKQGREVEYGFLGVQPENLSAEEGLKGVRGTRVKWVKIGTPAAHFGLKAGDLITSVGGLPVFDADSLVLQVGRLPVESLVRLAVVREGRPLEVDVALTKFPVRGKKIVTAPGPSWRGVRVDYPSAVPDNDSRTETESAVLDQSVIVIDVQQDSPAWTAGLRPGMLISRVDRQTVRTPKEFHAAVAGRTGPVELRLAESQGESPLRTVPPGS